MRILGSRVCSTVKLVATALVGILAIVQPGSAIPSATTTYNFVGTCNDCTGTGRGTLVLQNYTLGNALATGNLVSFSYSSNLISFTITSSTPNVSLVGTLPTNLPGAANVQINPTPPSNMFDSYTTDNAYWCAGNNCESDSGTNGTWSLAAATPTTTPAPNTLALIGIALVSVLMTQTLRKRAGAR